MGLVSFGCGRATKCGRVAVDLKVDWGWEWSDETAKWGKKETSSGEREWEISTISVRREKGDELHYKSESLMLSAACNTA